MTTKERLFYMLYKAAQEGDGMKLISLLSNGADPNAVPAHYTNSPLIAAAQNGYLILVKHLLCFGADPRYQSKVSGKTAQEYAYVRGYPEVATYLESYTKSLFKYDHLAEYYSLN